MPRQIDFYFDFISPFSYFAVQRLPSVARSFDYEVVFHVADLAVLKVEAGNTAPPTRSMPIKLRYMKADQARWADLYGVPIKTPAHYDSGLLNRGVFFASSRHCTQDYVLRAFHKVWGEGGHMTSDALLDSLASELGWSAREFRDFNSSSVADELYRESTKLACQRGVFGVPTMMIGEEMWWGNDRMAFMEKYLTEADKTRAGRDI
jgi:2-hydroxychromene-2-carboxylate isomerase